MCGAAALAGGLLQPCSGLGAGGGWQRGWWKKQNRLQKHNMRFVLVTQLLLALWAPTASAELPLPQAQVDEAPADDDAGALGNLFAAFGAGGE